VAFANDWADDLAIKTSTTVPESAWLPVTANLTVLANLNQLTVTAVNGSTVTVNTGLAPPTGGGFEIRLRDFAFMAGEDTGLVMRGSEQNLTFSRRQVNDRFYIRMYDGSTPPNYSEFSTAIFVNLALSS
jgi:type V secretory pathway adhesin AidA